MSYLLSLPRRAEREELDASLLWELGCQAIQEEDERLIAYFEEQISLPPELIGTWEQADETDWIAKYFEELSPIYLDKLIVAPSHRSIDAGDPRTVIYLDPGMAFGTGHHETTEMALASLERLDLQGKRVFDVGHGSGLLAIAADLLGAREAFGCDNDPITIPIARENARINKSKASFQEGVLDASYADGSVELIVANLFAELHVELAADYARVLSPQGDLIITGILDGN